MKKVSQVEYIDAFPRTYNVLAAGPVKGDRTFAFVILRNYYLRFRSSKLPNASIASAAGSGIIVVILPLNVLPCSMV